MRPDLQRRGRRGLSLPGGQRFVQKDQRGVRVQGTVRNDQRVGSIIPLLVGFGKGLPFQFRDVDGGAPRNPLAAGCENPARSGHRQAVRIPVLLTGGVTTLAQARALLEEGSADLIGVGRAIFRDPHWAD